MRRILAIAAAIGTTLGGAALAATAAQAATATPIVTSVTLSHGAAGDTVVVSGSNLTDPANGTDPLPSAVTFGGVAAHVNSCAAAPAASCSVTVPAGTGTVDVRVADGADGISAVNEPGDLFTYGVSNGTPPSVVTVRYVCGTNRFHFKWRVANVSAAGTRDVFVNLMTQYAPRPRRFWQGQIRLPAGVSATVVTSEGTQLDGFYEANGSKPPLHEAGALVAKGGLPRRLHACGSLAATYQF